MVGITIDKRSLHLGKDVNNKRSHNLKTPGKLSLLLTFICILVKI